MNLENVMAEIAAAARPAARALGVVDRQIFLEPPDSISPPSMIISYPESVTFDQTYGRGMDVITGLPLIIAIGRPTNTKLAPTAKACVSGSGPKSIKAALEAHDWTTCSEVTATRADFDVVSIGGDDVLICAFSLTVAGIGA